MARPLRLPGIHNLCAFEAAARLGGFAQAADELCITPSAVSHRIHQLESLLGDQLFERSSTGARLTEAGQRYLLRVRDAFDKLSHDKEDTGSGVLRLRVGAPPTFSRNMLIARLPEFYRQWPDIEIEVDAEAPLFDRHERHDVDIRWGAGIFDERVTIKLFDDVIEALVRPSLAESLALRVPSDLSRVELLRTPLLPWRPWFQAAQLDWPEPTRGPIFTTLGILLEAAATGLGAVVCSRRVAANWVAAGQLVALFGISAPAPNTYYVLFEREKGQRPEVAAFVEWLLEAFAKGQTRRS
jgi:LysR family transcriptional regulator, glycine cleavage system transcriptional activator